jgi:hypothetical protein
VIFSVFGYFFYMIMAFSAITALLIGLSNNSAVENVLHYPRPIIDETDIATSLEPSNVLNKPKTKEEAPAKDKKGSRIVSVAKADVAKRKSEIKSKPEKLAHLHKPKVLARQRERQEEGYSVVLGYAEGSGYRPGLDSQR